MTKKVHDAKYPTPADRTALLESYNRKSIRTGTPLTLFVACPNAFDEVWLGTLTGLPPLEQHAECARRNALAADKFRELGVGVSLQVCETFGHRGYGVESYAAWQEWKPMFNHDGAINSHVPCPFYEDFLA